MMAAAVPIPTTNTQKGPVDPIQTLPKEVVINILDFLPPSTLGKAAQVSRSWNIAASDPLLWQRKVQRATSKSTFEVFARLVQTGRCSWKEAYRSLSLSEFLGTVENDCQNSSGTLIDSRVAELKRINPGLRETWRETPWPFTSIGDRYYSISNGSDIRLYQRGQTESTLFEAEEKVPITGLRLHQNSLFALRCDGMIIQREAQSGRIIRAIPTAFSRRHPPLMEALDNWTEGDFMTFHNFYIENGYIVVKYGLGTNPFLEIIPLSNPDASHLLNDRDVGHPRKIAIQNDTLYLLNRTQITPWDLRTYTKQPLIHPPINPGDYLDDLAIGHQMIAASHSQVPSSQVPPLGEIHGEIYILNRGTRELIRTIPIPHAAAKKLFTIQNLLICFSSENQYISLIDWQTGAITARFEPQLDPTGRFFAPDLFPHLIDLVRTHSTPVQEIPQQPAPGGAGPANPPPGGGCVIS